MAFGVADDGWAYERLLEKGLDKMLARHVSRSLARSLTRSHPILPRRTSASRAWCADETMANGASLASHRPHSPLMLASPCIPRQVAHLFSRDPLVIFKGRTSEVDDNESTEHFENLQSTNWQTVC